MSTYLPVRNSVFSLRRNGSGSVVKRWAWIGAVLVAAALAGSVLAGSSTGGSAPPLVVLPMAAGGASARLNVRGISVARQHDFVTVYGEAGNVSLRSLGNVEAVVEFFDAAGRLRRVESALLELPSLRPGEESPFAVQTRDAPSLSSCRIRFRHLLGPSIPARETGNAFSSLRPGG